MKKYIKYLLLGLVVVMASCSDTVYEPVQYRVVQYRTRSYIYYPRYQRPAPPPPRYDRPLPPPPINNNKRHGPRH